MGNADEVATAVADEDGEEEGAAACRCWVVDGPMSVETPSCWEVSILLLLFDARAEEGPPTPDEDVTDLLVAPESCGPRLSTLINPRYCWFRGLDWGENWSGLLGGERTCLC